MKFLIINAQDGLGQKIYSHLKYKGIDVNTYNFQRKLKFIQNVDVFIFWKEKTQEEIIEKVKIFSPVLTEEKTRFFVLLQTLPIGTTDNLQKEFAHKKVVFLYRPVLDDFFEPKFVVWGVPRLQSLSSVNRVIKEISQVFNPKIKTFIVLSYSLEIYCYYRAISIFLNDMLFSLFLLKYQGKFYVLKDVLENDEHFKIKNPLVVGSIGKHLSLVEEMISEINFSPKKLWNLNKKLLKLQGLEKELRDWLKNKDVVLDREIELDFDLLKSGIFDKTSEK